jgi:hypothetical protein
VYVSNLLYLLTVLVRDAGTKTAVLPSFMQYVRKIILWTDCSGIRARDISTMYIHVSVVGTARLARK